MNFNHVTVPVLHLDECITFYKTLGLQLIVKTDTYARFIVPGNQATLSLAVQADMQPKGVEVCFECQNLDETVAQLKQKGQQFKSDPTDRSWLWRDAHLSDPDGNKIMLYHAGENRLNPPWRIKE